MMNLNLPYKIEYTPPYNDSNCFKCGNPFQPAQLRIAAMIQSKHHDGKDPLWHHKQCFFQQYILTSYQEIENFEGIKYTHQTEIILHIDPSQTSRLQEIFSKSAEDLSCHSSSANNFGIEYSTSNEGLCKECNDTIFYNEIRVKTTIYDSEIASKFGKEIQWHHLHCFVFSREQHKFRLSGEMLPGFNDLQAIHQQIVKDSIHPLDEVQNYKIQPFEQPFAPIETCTEKEFDMERTFASQTARLFRNRQTLQIVCSEDELKRFLIFNSSNIVDGLDNLLDRCADFLTFGALYKCQKCSEGDLIFTKYGYTCNGMTNEWIECGHFDEKPLRLKCRIPDDMRLVNIFPTSTLTIENRAVRPKNTDNLNGIAAAFKTCDIKSPHPEASKVNTIKLKDGSAVDQKSGLENVAHVFCLNGVLYSTVLGLTDIQRNKNSYLKIQVLEADRVYARKYWLFSSWGRIGTEIGDCKVEAYKSHLDATEQFKKLYEQQTGNSWQSRSLKKFVGKFYPIDINYAVKIKADYSIKSNLLPDVKELMKMIFNTEAMELSMVDDFQLDLEKMPLGKLSSEQLQQANLTLVELENGIEAGRSEMELIGLSNKFFTLIPQNFGMEQVPIIDTIDKINAKRKIVNSLTDIERAYSLMIIEDLDRNINPFDAYYFHLKTDIQQLNQNANEYKLIETYVSRSQGFRVADIFTINRQGENARYSPYRELPNRMLLWHGTRITNIASILRNGLKIGNVDHFYGRGIYFADVCTQSLAYCYPVGNVDLMILAEVASYQTHEGNITPDPNEAHIRDDGVIIPIGRLLRQAYMHNKYTEYVAVDEAHVNIQYLVKIEKC